VFDEFVAMIETPMFMGNYVYAAWILQSVTENLWQNPMAYAAIEWFVVGRQFIVATW
jgi:hypothetical protein